MNKILLYYKYVSVEYPHQLLKWQRKVCDDLNLKGRIIIAHEGINGTVGGTSEQCEHYKRIMRKNPLFADVIFKESEAEGTGFAKMRIVVKNEIVHLGLSTTAFKAGDGGVHLDPTQTHTLIASQPKDLVILDARNRVEWHVGKFANAITPAIETFRELPAYIDANLEQFKDKQVLMYCTGGVRCERASAYLKSKGVAKQVYQVSGGIQTYVEQFPDGFFRGKNYVFDDRIAVKINEDILSTCALCPQACDTYTNCLNALCNDHFVCCPPCLQRLQNCCSQECLTLLETKQVEARPLRAASHQSRGDAR